MTVDDRGGRVGFLHVSVETGGSDGEAICRVRLVRHFCGGLQLTTTLAGTVDLGGPAWPHLLSERANAHRSAGHRKSGEPSRVPVLGDALSDQPVELLCTPSR